MLSFRNKVLGLVSREFSPGRRRSLWTAEKVVLSPCADVEVPACSLADYMWRHIEKWPTKTALVCGITNRSYTYEQFYRRARSLAASLRARMGVRDGDVAAVMMPNSPEYPVAVLGVLAAGGVVSTINPLYTAYEVHRQLEISESKLMITTPEIVPVIREALMLLKKDMKIVTVCIGESVPEGTISFFELAVDGGVDTSGLRAVRRGPDDVALLPYSSGTTGLPKGVQLTNRNIIANCQQQAGEMRQYDYTTSSNQDTVLAVLPYFHAYGLSMVMMQKLSAGLKEVVLPAFKPDTYLKALVKYKVNLLFAAPPMVLFMSCHAEVQAKHFEHLKCILSGAAPLAAADIQKIIDKAGRDIDFVQGYGLTESGPLATAGPRGYRNYSSVGFALPNVQLRVVDAELNNLGPDQVGELLIKGPNVMKGYKDNEAANREAFVEGGWLRSGDLARVDAAGAVTIADRLKELIKVKGHQVPPAELEALLREHPDVLDAAVIGVPDPAAGERPRAFVVLRKNKTTKPDDIQQFVSQRVAPYKQLKDLRFITSIPKNPSGKILRKVLREEYGNK